MKFLICDMRPDFVGPKLRISELEYLQSHINKATCQSIRAFGIPGRVAKIELK